MAFAQSAPSEKAFMANVEAGICPFCGRGPYKVLACHTNKIHAVDRFQLREMAGLCHSATITSPEYHAEVSERARKQYEENVVFAARQSNKGKKYKLSTAAIDVQRRKSQRSKVAQTERLRPECKQAVEMYQAVVGELGGKCRSGDEHAYGAVTETARRLGWHESTVRRRLALAAKLGMTKGDKQ